MTFELLSDKAKLPSRGTRDSVGYDINYSGNKVDLLANETKMFETGLRLISVPPKTFIKIESRSSLAIKGIIAVAGIIDPDYDLEIKVVLINTSSKPYTFDHGDRIAQMIFYKYETPKITLYDGDTGCEVDIGHYGFGSTGK
jgi:dUTP pyrophosphatase